MTDIFVVIYLDDILIFSNSLEDHQVHVRCFLDRLRKYDLHSKPEKCLFHTQKIEFLGFMVTPTGISMDSAKTNAVTIWPTPTNLKAVQAFLGFANFYHWFIIGFSDIIIPLFCLTHKDTPFTWGPDHTAAFETLKTAFTQAPILVHLNPDNLRLMLLTMRSLRSSPRFPPTMVTSTQLRSTHATCSQQSSTTRSMIRNCLQYLRPSNNGATTSRALLMSCLCSPITRTSST